MGRKMQEKHSNSFWNNHDPKFNRNLLHIIKHHPLHHHLIKQSYRRDGAETSVAGNVSQRDEVFSDDQNKNFRFAETRNSNVKEKLTPNSSVGKTTLRRHINALIKEISKKRSRLKSCLQCDSTLISDYLGCKHQPKKNVSSTKFYKMKQDILLTFLHDPANFHKQHVHKSKMTLTRSLSCPLPRGYTIIEPINNGSLSKGQGKSYSAAQVINKPIKNLKQKLEHVTGESGKEKVRVAMDSVIHKIPQGHHHGISDELKNEILKKLTESNEASFPKHHQYRNSMRRIWSLQEPLESYCQYQENNSFITEARYSQSEALKSKTEKAYSQLIPYKRILSLPDLQSYSKSQLQLDTVVEDLTQENLVNVDENDLLIIDEFGHSGLRNNGTFNDQDTGTVKEYKVEIEASDSKSKPGHVEQQEANIDSPKVNETTKNAQKVIPNFHVDTTNKDEFNYVKYVLEISGLTTNDCHSSWHSKDTPVDPLLYEEMEDDPDFCTYESGKCNHHELFDLINETLLEIYGRSYCYPPMKFTIHEVWDHMKKILCLRSKDGHQTIDDHVIRDLSKVDGWVKNIQFYNDCVGLEVEDLIFHDLIEEIMWDLACF